MTRIPRWLLAAMVILVLGGCVSDRGAEPEPTPISTPSAGGIPTLPALAQLPPTPTPQPTLTPVPTPTPVTGQTAPSRVDSPLALPREPLEDLGLVPQETGVDIFYQLALTHYEGRALFDNYWEHPEEATARIAYVSDFRYAFPSRTQTDAFLFNASYGLIQAAAGDGNDVTEYYAYLGDTSFVAGFTKPGQAVYAAQFATGTTAAVVIIAGNDTVSVDEALGIFRLAADALGAGYSDDGTPVRGSTISGMVTGEWMARQREVLIGADGTGHVRLNSGCCNGVVYYVTIEDHASPTRATVVGRSFVGDIGHTDAGLVGDVIWLEIRADGAYEVLVITLPESEKNFIRELTLCRDPLDPPCEW